MESRLVLSMITLLAFLSQCGCTHVGPNVIVADRGSYNDAIATSWKEQTLLNIVKVRYVDTPFFIDVPQITSGYTLERSGTTDLSINPAFFLNAPFDDLLAARLGLRASFQDRPTISYTPQTGSQFIRNVTTPISPSSVLFLVQAGYAADMVLDIAVESINGVKNRASAGGPASPRRSGVPYATQAVAAGATVRHRRVARRAGQGEERDGRVLLSGQGHRSRPGRGKDGLVCSGGSGFASINESPSDMI